MAYVILAVLAGICAAILISIIRARARYKLFVFMLLLENEERGGEKFLKISYGADPHELERLLKSMVKGGLLEEQNSSYRLTPNGLHYARQVRKKIVHRR